MNQRHDQVSGGKDRIALPLKAASVTTSAGKSRKPTIAVTVMTPRKRKSLCDSQCGISVRSKPFQRPGRRTHQCQHRESECEAGNRQAGREGEVEARESELIDEGRDHVDPAAPDQLRGGECAEGPGERGGDPGDDPGRGERQRDREKGADRSGTKARGCPLVVA